MGRAKDSFDEAAYLTLNPDVASAVARGAFRSGFEHWVRHGKQEGRLAAFPADFDELGYLALNPDVEDDVLRTAIRSGYGHWQQRGRAEGRKTEPSPEWPADWDEGRYLRLNPDVQESVRTGRYPSGYAHWLARGQYEARPGASCPYQRVSAAAALENYPAGVNSYGFHEATIGQSYAARGYLREIQELLPAIAANIPWVTADAGCAAEQPPAPYAFNLVQINPDRLRDFLVQYGAAALPGRYNIAAWVWELHAGYPEWWSLSRVFQEIWVPSSFVARAVEPVVTAPVFTIPYVVDELPEDDGIGRELFGWPPGQFVFLYVFDMASAIRRKNPLALLRAFRRAFTGGENVLLVLKYQHGDRNPSAAGLLQAAARGRENVRLIADTLPEKELYGLLRSCDCFVSPHRAEGFGLNIAAAMYYGKPVIATGYSGNMDYTNEANSFLIDFELAPIGRDIGYYRAEYAWADADEEHLAHLLRRAYTQREEAARRGTEGQLTVREMFSRARVREKIAERVRKWMAEQTPGLQSG